MPTIARRICAKLTAPQTLTWIWAVGISPCLFLCGVTVHALNVTLRPLPDQLENAFEQSTHLAVEVDVTKTSVPAPAWVSKHLLLPNNSGLTSLLDETRRDRLACILEQMSIDAG